VAVERACLKLVTGVKGGTVLAPLC